MSETTRTVSTNHLEKVRIRKELTIGDFLNELKALNTAGSYDSINELFNAYRDANKSKGGGAKNSDDPNVKIINALFDSGFFSSYGDLVDGGIRRTSKLSKDEADANVDRYNVTIKNSKDIESKIYVRFYPNGDVTFGFATWESDPIDLSNIVSETVDETDPVAVGENTTQEQAVMASGHNHNPESDDFDDEEW